MRMTKQGPNIKPHTQWEQQQTINKNNRISTLEWTAAEPLDLNIFYRPNNRTKTMMNCRVGVDAGGGIKYI